MKDMGQPIPEKLSGEALLADISKNLRRSERRFYRDLAIFCAIPIVITIALKLLAIFNPAFRFPF